MTDKDGRSGGGASGSAVDTSVNPQIIAALQQINRRLDRLERIVHERAAQDEAVVGQDKADDNGADADFSKPTTGLKAQAAGKPDPTPSPAHPATDEDGKPLAAPGRPLPPPPRDRGGGSGARGVLTLLIAVGLLAGGIYWVSENLGWRDSLSSNWFGRLDGAVSDDSAADGTPLAEIGDREDTADEQNAIGRAIPATPRGTIEVVELAEGLAPLPEDASADLRRLARQSQAGDPQAQHDLAFLYAVGAQVPRNTERAAFWFARSAEAGVTSAIHNLAVLLQRGDGIEQDSTAAARLFRRAAEDGHAEAQFALGLAYQRGRGVEVDPQEAASWFQAASANGFAPGAYHLGRLFESGFEGEPDLAAAAGWYRIAANAGDRNAEVALARLNPGDAVANLPVIDVPTRTAVAPIPDTAPEPVSPGGNGPAPLTRDEISEIQQRLEALGYDPGPVDGLMGERTGEAIAAFQQDRGLRADGQASADLLGRLRDVEPAS